MPIRRSEERILARYGVAGGVDLRHGRAGIFFGAKRFFG